MVMHEIAEAFAKHHRDGCCGPATFGVAGVEGDTVSGADGLGAVAVQFDLVEPLRAIGQFRHREAFHWLDEFGLHCLGHTAACVKILPN
jgi:hypothetical protein